MLFKYNHPEVVKILYPKIKELEANLEKSKKEKEDQKISHELSDFKKENM